MEEFLYEKMKMETSGNLVEVQVNLVLRGSLLCLYLDCCIFILFCNDFANTLSNQINKSIDID